MHRIIIELPWFTICSYGLLVTLGFTAAILYFLAVTTKEHLSQRLMLNLVLGIVIFALVGARAFYVLIHFHHYLLHPKEVCQISEGGMVLYGGLLFSLAFSLYYIKTRNLFFSQIADCAAPAIAFGLSIGRIGCFLNGCCYGIPSSFGFIFPLTSPAGECFPYQRLFPTQLTSSLNLFLIGLVLHIFKKRGIAKHKLLLLFLIFYAVHRFFIEFLRGDVRPVILNLTLFQVVSIALIVSSVIIWWRVNG